MSQNVVNDGNIDSQLNIGNNSGDIYTSKPTRWSKRFQRLNEEVKQNIKYEQFIDDLKTYNTQLDGKSTEEKLEDGNFTQNEIFHAIVRKESYSKKLERNINYETAQKIDTEIFALIKLNFEGYVQPLIFEEVSKQVIKTTLIEKVISPILVILNEEGGDDEFLNYTADDILGMLYFLTGKCHINWANYDNI